MRRRTHGLKTMNRGAVCGRVTSAGRTMQVVCRAQGMQLLRHVGVTSTEHGGSVACLQLAQIKMCIVGANKKLAG